MLHSSGSGRRFDRRSSPAAAAVPRTIGLLDHMGYGNLGDAAIQEAVIANIRKRVPDARLVGFSLVPDDTAERHGIPCHPITWWYPKRAHTPSANGSPARFAARLTRALKRQPGLRACGKPLLDLLREARFWVRSYRTVRRLDVLIFSGGGQLGELWRGPWAHPYTIFKFAVLAKLARTRLYFLNVGAGPLQHPLSRFFARWAVRVADYRSFRDHDSQQLVRSLGVGAEIFVHPDPAYALELGDHSGGAPSDSPAPVVGLNPIGFCDPRIWSRHDDGVYQRYLDKTARFSAWLLEYGYTLRVFTTETSVDRYAIADLKARLEARGVAPELISGIFRAPSPTVKDVLHEMAGFDFIVTSKFHGIIFTHLLQKPVIALSYHRKMDAAMRALGQERFCADIEHFDVDWLIEGFRTLVHESRAIRARCQAAVEGYAADLARQFDRLFLPDESSTGVLPHTSPNQR